METAIINSNNKADIKLLLDLAKKIGVHTKVLSRKEIEEMGLSNAIKKGRTGEYIDTDAYLKKLRK
ncbi:MAG: hypothetical protein WCH21_08505 [Bacteroidota bacterium]|jgi:hypothetical protein